MTESDIRASFRRWRKIVAGLAIVGVTAAIYLAGPRVATDTTVSFQASHIGENVADYVAAREADVSALRPDAAREIVWADPNARMRTPLALVYVHGFSASKGEIRPVPDEVAHQLGANLYFMRLTGHGQDGPAMGEASVQSWINDYAEAVEVGRRLGERVIVLATSTGGTLATWASTQPALSQDVVALILVSPNYQSRRSGAWLLTGPWGERVAQLVWGNEHGFTPLNEAHARLWTTRYPTRAILPMLALVALARKASVESTTIPTLFIYSPHDEVVNANVTARIASNWRGQADSLVIEQSGDSYNHVITGNALSPQTNKVVVGTIIGWLSDKGF